MALILYYNSNMKSRYFYCINNNEFLIYTIEVNKRYKITINRNVFLYIELNDISVLLINLFDWSSPEKPMEIFNKSFITEKEYHDRQFNSNLDELLK